MKAAPEGVAMFDPWHANTSEMEAAQTAWLASGKNGSPEDPASQFWAVANIAARRVKITLPGATDEKAREILWCVRVCLSHRIIAPEWLADAFSTRFDAVFNAEVGSWGDPLAFGTPYPKGTHIAALRKGLKNGPKVVKAVEALLESNPETAIDKGLFQQIGKPLGLGATLAEELYYDFRVKLPQSKKSRGMNNKSLPGKLKK